jgi:hypothetical protein
LQQHQLKIKIWNLKNPEERKCVMIGVVRIGKMQDEPE